MVADIHADRDGDAEHSLTRPFHDALLDAWRAWEEGRVDEARASVRRAEAYTNKRLNGAGRE